jgi:hypothetical protein
MGDTPGDYPSFCDQVRTVRGEGSPHGGTMADGKHVGRHRLGTPGLMHCVQHRSVAEALEEYRRTWLTALLVPAKHSFAGLRRRARVAAQERIWFPTVPTAATATT